MPTPYLVCREGIDMTNRTADPSVQHDTRGARQPARPGVDADRSIRQASVIAGAGILLMTPLAVFGNFVALEGLVTRGDAARTAADVMASEGMFRLGIASWLLVVILDVVVAWALLRVFRPASPDVSILAAWFRLAYAAVLMVAVSQLVGIPSLLSAAKESSAFSPDQVADQALMRVSTFDNVYDLALILFGVHLLIVGYLAFRSGYVPRILGILLGIAGFGYMFDSFAGVLLQDAPVISSFTFVGEFLLALWLVFRGRRLTLSGSRSTKHPVVVAQ
jgi:hypothetical protein